MTLAIKSITNTFSCCRVSRKTISSKDMYHFETKKKHSSEISFLMTLQKVF